MKKNLLKKAKKAYLNSLTANIVNPEKVRNQVSTILAGKRSEILPVLKIFKKLIDKKINEQKLKVSTAILLDAKTRKEMTKKLNQVFENISNVEYVESKNILGGVKIQVGDRVYNSSLEAKLKLLEEFDG